MIEMLIKTIKYAKKVDYVLIDTYSTKNFWYAFIISQLCRIFNLKYIHYPHGEIYHIESFEVSLFQN